MPVGIEVKPLSASSSMKKQRLAKMRPEIRMSINIKPSSLMDCLRVKAMDCSPGEWRPSLKIRASLKILNTFRDKE